MIAVSGDRDWIGYFETSDDVYPAPDLRTALALFQEDDQLAELFKAGIANEEGPYEVIRNAIQESIRDLDFKIDYSTEWRVDVEPYDAQVKTLALDAANEAYQIISSDASSITLSINITTILSISLIASFMVIDGIDHDEVPLGSETFSRAVEHTFAVVATVQGKGTDHIDVADAAVSPDTRFRYIDVDYIGFSGFPPDED